MTDRVDPLTEQSIPTIDLMTVAFVRLAASAIAELDSIHRPPRRELACEVPQVCNSALVVRYLYWFRQRVAAID